MTIKIFIADDHRILREGLRSLIEKMSDVRVVGDAGNGREAVRLVTERRPDVVIMDVNMPHLNGIEATRLLLKELPAVKVIGLSMYSDKRFVAGMLRAGASGYLLKASAFEELATAVQTVMARYLPESESHGGSDRGLRGPFDATKISSGRNVDSKGARDPPTARRR